MSALGDIVRSHLARVERLRDERLYSHENRVGALAAAISWRMDLPGSFVHAIERAAALHDIGKITIPDRLLSKPADLDPAEQAAMRQHCEMAHAILSGTDDPVLEMAAEIGWSHHECFDGSGYPRALVGEAIPLPGRIAAVCDVYDALRENRVYRAGLTHAAAVEVVVRGDGRITPSKFDPTVLVAFAAIADEIGWHA